jgi:hypothetical protein
VKRLLLVALALIPAITVFTQSTSVEGRWEVAANIGGTSTQMDCMFKQKDTELTGTCEGDSGALPITGKVEGKTVTFQFNAQHEGQALTVIYTGTLESADKITGSVDVQPLSVSGDFVAKRAK